jgi:archaetidylinositol phosphate synthase
VTLRDRIGDWLTPLARRCPFSPNAITIVAFVLNFVAAVALALSREVPWTVIPAILLFSIGAICDGFDGVVARVKGLASKRGDFLDHMLDRASDGMILTGWLIAVSVRIEIALPVLLAVMLNGYAGTQLEASFGERDYSDVGRGEFITAMIALPIITAVLAFHGYSELRWVGFSIGEWFALLILLFAILGIVQRIRRGMERKE